MNTVYSIMHLKLMSSVKMDINYKAIQRFSR